MIFGLTEVQQRRLITQEHQERERWKRKFAWTPRKLLDGRFAWLQWVETRDRWSAYALYWFEENRLPEPPSGCTCNLPGGCCICPPSQLDRPK